MSTESIDARASTRTPPASGESPNEYARPEGSRRAKVSRSATVKNALQNVDPATSLGWLSIGLGLTALLAPRAIGELTGLRNRSGVLRFVGARELASGMGLLTQRERTPWLWSRVVGDTMDLALLGSACRRTNPARTRALGTLGAVAAITALDIAASLRASSRGRFASAPAGRLEPVIEHTVAVLKSPQECYAFWRDISNLAKISDALESVTALDARRSHWVMRGPGGVRIEWDSELTLDRESERLAWHSLPGSTVRHAGIIRFEPAPGNRGTHVTVLMHYHAGGRAGRALAKLLGRDPNGTVREDLRRFKSLIETGEIPTTRGQPSGRRSLFGRLSAEGRKSRQGA
jgi:uncharacterized membrane protein